MRRKIYWCILALLLITGIVVYLSVGLDRWSLFICETNIGGEICFGRDSQLETFSSFKDCLSYGKINFSDNGFECGKNCEGGREANICKEICNSSGCR